jgi:hypothetical protein
MSASRSTSGVTRSGSRVGGWGIRRTLEDAHVADEAVPPTTLRADEALRRDVSADRAARRLDARRQRRFGHELVAPDRIEQLDLQHQPVTLDDQVHEHIKDLRLDAS